eukprot:COSAG03_NODE_25055_length_268_cov_0.609467_1_plen_32_part_01
MRRLWQAARSWEVMALAFSWVAVAHTAPPAKL